MKVGVAHAAGPDADERFTRARVGDEHGLQRDGPAPAESDHTWHFVVHR